LESKMMNSYPSNNIPKDIMKKYPKLIEIIVDL